MNPLKAISSNVNKGILKLDVLEPGRTVEPEEESEAEPEEPETEPEEVPEEEAEVVPEEVPGG